MFSVYLHSDDVLLHLDPKLCLSQSYTCSTCPSSSTIYRVPRDKTFHFPFTQLFSRKSPLLSQQSPIQTSHPFTPVQLLLQAPLIKPYALTRDPSRSRMPDPVISVHHHPRTRRLLFVAADPHQTRQIRHLNKMWINRETMAPRALAAGYLIDESVALFLVESACC